MTLEKPKVFASGLIPVPVRERLARAVDINVREELTPIGQKELIDSLQGCVGLLSVLGDDLDAEFMDACPELKVIATVAVGYDNIDVKAAAERGILVLNTPGVLDNAVADLAFGLLLACARRIVESDKYVRDGRWDGWRADLMLGHDLTGKTLGIIGMGRIGEAMARRSNGFGMKVIYTRRGNEEKDSRYYKELSAVRVSLPDLIRSADYISIHCPLTAETRNLIGKVEFSRMKENSVLINTSRGAVLDQAALIGALQSGRLAAAGLDVFEDEPNVPSELKEMRNVVLTPHIGSATSETRGAMAMLAAEGLVMALSQKLPANCVNKDAWAKFVDRVTVKHN